MTDPKTGIHEPTVQLPWWMDCKAPIGFSKRNPNAWKLTTPEHVSIHLSKDADNE